ncbi:MAG: hypothetical protein ABJJ53_02600 [Sulfitobacter sp.]
MDTDVFGMHNLLNEDLVARMHEEENFEVKSDTDFGCDVLVVTPIPLELRSAALAFGQDIENPTSRVKSLSVFEFDLSRRGGLAPLSVVLTTINSQMNLNSGPRTSQLIERHKPRLVILSGIAGTRNDQALGTCNAFSSVTYVAGGVETVDGKLPENKVDNISEEMNNLISTHADRRNRYSEQSSFKDEIFSLIPQIDGLVPSKEQLETFDPKFSVKKLLSGETLRKDGGFKEQSDEIDRLITMVEMEASGFATSCVLANVEWLVFRAGCDYADSDKSDEWQHVAALNAALSIKYCLQSDFRFQEEMNY